MKLAAAIAAMTVAAGSMANEGEGGGCTAKNSRALCVAAAARVAQGMKDSKPSELKPYVDGRAADSAWYAGAALGAATKAFSPTPGIPMSVEVGLMVLGAVSAANAKEPELVGRNLILAWMPENLAASPSEAEELAQQYVFDGIAATFSDSTFTLETVPGIQESEAYGLARREQIRYRVSGGKCAGRECILTPQLMKQEELGLLGTRAKKGKTPDFIGSGNAYIFGTRVGAIWAWSLTIDGKPATHLYLPELSKSLPAWMYIALSPEKRFKDNMVLNEGQRLPVIYNRGQAMYFAFPAELDSRPTAVSLK